MSDPTMSWGNALRADAIRPWPARMVLLQIAVIYGAAGLAKLRYSGLRWLDGRTIAYYLAGESPRSRQHFGAREHPRPADLWRDGFALEHHTYVSPPRKLAKRVAQSATLCRLLSVLTILLELGFVAVLFSRRLVLPMLGAAVVMHECIILLLDANFRDYYPVFMLFVDWSAVARWARAQLSGPRSPPPPAPP